MWGAHQNALWIFRRTFGDAVEILPLATQEHVFLHQPSIQSKTSRPHSFAAGAQPLFHIAFYSGCISALVIMIRTVQNLRH